MTRHPEPDFEKIKHGLNVVVDLIEEGYGGQEIGQAVVRLSPNHERITKDELRAEVERMRSNP